MIRASIRKRFPPGPDSAPFDLEVDLQTGSGITVLFGPSGSGKTLTLDCIAGFVRPDGGRIAVCDELLFDPGSRVNLTPQQRRCGYVFQNYALFPHMTLRQNLEFAASVGPKRVAGGGRVDEMLERFRLTGEAGRRPHEVSGGQKQRCSIARALIGAPRVLLLDEPARGLDAPLRADLYTLLRQVSLEFATPILMVTHDVDECLELGDSMIVMTGGRLVRTGAPREVVADPATLDVARLLGIYNLIPAEIRALDPIRNFGCYRVCGADIRGPYVGGHAAGDRVTICIAPAALSATPVEGAPGENRILCTLARSIEKADRIRLEFDNGFAVETLGRSFDRGVRNWAVEFPAEAIRVL